MISARAAQLEFDQRQEADRNMEVAEHARTG